VYTKTVNHYGNKVYKSLQTNINKLNKNELWHHCFYL